MRQSTLVGVLALSVMAGASKGALAQEGGRIIGQVVDSSGAAMPGVSFYSQGFVSTMSVHGSASADQRIYFDGMPTQILVGRFVKVGARLEF